MEQIYSHFPILQVVVPLILAPICVVIGRSTASWLIAFFASVTSLVIALSLLFSVSDGSSISYHIGGWPPPIGIEYVVDSANAFLLVLVCNGNKMANNVAGTEPYDLLPRIVVWNGSGLEGA